MSAGSVPDMSEFAEFADALETRRARSEWVVRQALARVSGHHLPDEADDLASVSHELDDAYASLDSAAEELRVQNEALFSARVELEKKAVLFRDLFELAPTPYLVTNVDGRVSYANDAACSLLRCPK